MPLRLTAEQQEAFYVLARKAGEQEQRAYVQTGKLFSGADCAEAPFYGMLRKGWIGLSRGTPIKLVIANLDTEWRRYAELNNTKVGLVGKIRNGPSSGLSVLSHRWVSLEKLQSAIPYIYTMFNKIMKGE